VTGGLQGLGAFVVKLPEEYLMRGIHPYGDTYFNMIQLKILLREAGLIEESFPEQAGMLRLIRDAAEQAISLRGYLKFIGD
jgi:hypothetical protein